MTIVPISTFRPITNTLSAAGDVKKPSLLLSSPPPESTPKTLTIRTRLSNLCQNGQPHLARQLFDTIPNPSTALWNTIIIGYVCNNSPAEALLFYTRMKSHSPHPLTQCDAYTYSSTLKACSEAGDLRLGKALHSHLLRCSPQSSRIADNSLLNMYASLCNTDGLKSDAVKKVFDSMNKRDVVSWNTLVSWYVKVEKYFEAVRHFRAMIRLGVEPSPVSFVNVFPAALRVGDCGFLLLLYGMVLKLGGKFADDVFVVSSVINSFAELGMLDYARKVFDECSNKNTEIWNSMISGYIQNNHFNKAIDLFLEAANQEPKITDEVTFVHALTAVSMVQSIKLSQQFHAYVMKNLGALPVVILNSLMIMYSRSNSIDSSRLLFSKTTDKDVVSWNTMISSLVNNGYNEEGLNLIYEMQNKRLELDSVTLSSILSAASNTRNPSIGKQAHAYLTRKAILFEGIESYLIDMYAKSGLISSAKHVFEGSATRDQATWNAMIGGYSQNSLMEEACSTVREMMKRNIAPNAVTLSSVLSGCSKWGSLEMGKQLHCLSLRYFLHQNLFTSTALVDMYSKTGAIDYAERVFWSSIEKNSVTYTAMMTGYGHHGMGEKALALFHIMRDNGIALDEAGLTAILSACSYSNMVDEGIEIFRGYEGETKAQHLCCVADMLGRSGRVHEAYEFVKGMGEKGDLMEIWGAVLGACKLHGEIELGELVAQRLLRVEDLKGFAGYKVLLSNMYAEEGSWDSVNVLRRGMREKGIRKILGCTWIDVGGRITHFVSKDEHFLRNAHLCATLEALFGEMEDGKDDFLFNQIHEY